MVLVVLATACSGPVRHSSTGTTPRPAEHSHRPTHTVQPQPRTSECPAPPIEVRTEQWASLQETLNWYQKQYPSVDVQATLQYWLAQRRETLVDRNPSWWFEPAYSYLDVLLVERTEVGGQCQERVLQLVLSPNEGLWRVQTESDFAACRTSPLATPIDVVYRFLWALQDKNSHFLKDVAPQNSIKVRQFVGMLDLDTCEPAGVPQKPVVSTIEPAERDWYSQDKWKRLPEYGRIHLLATSCETKGAESVCTIGGHMQHVCLRICQTNDAPYLCEVTWGDWAH